MSEQIGIVKDIKEVEEFFKNLGIEYRFGCYYEKKPQACDLLGDYMENIKEDLEKASKVYHDNCENNKFPMSCMKYGIYLLKGKGSVKQDIKKAADYFYRSCTYSDGNKIGCFYSGQMLVATDPEIKPYVKQDLKTGLEHLEKGCTLGLPDSCFTASSFYIFGKEGCEKNMKKAFEMSLKGCEMDHVKCCSNLSQMYALGEGTEKNQQLAKKYREKTLDMYNEIKNARHVEFQRIG